MPIYKFRLTFKPALVVFLFGLFAGFTSAQDGANDIPGRELTTDEIEHLDNHIFPDGRGLPDGQGTVANGQVLYTENCAACHGSSGEGANSVELIGDRELLTSQYPDRGIAVVWPYAPTLYEYINRAMPPDKTGAFSSEELYSIVGYVLHLNELLPANASVDKSVLAGLIMPNRNGFRDVWRSDTEANGLHAGSEQSVVPAADAESEKTATNTHDITAVAVKFNPMFTYIDKGDTVSWSSMGGHNIETLDQMVPAGQAKINSELGANVSAVFETEGICLLYTSPSPRDGLLSRMPSSA